MATRLVPSYITATDYTQAQEDALALTLAGQASGASVIFNTTIGKTRVWNGSIFISIPVLSLDGSSWPTTFTPAAHNHDANYAALNHNHDAAYSALNHNHDSVYSRVNTAALGYATGVGGTISQSTNKTTGVTLNKLCGQITTHNAALAAGAEVKFTVTNSQVAANDVPVIAIKSGGTSGGYVVSVGAVAAGSFDIVLSNASAGSLSEALVINFLILKSVTS